MVAKICLYMHVICVCIYRYTYISTNRVICLFDTNYLKWPLDLEMQLLIESKQFPH